MVARTAPPITLDVVADNPYESPAVDEPAEQPVRPWLACPHCGQEAMGPWKKLAGAPQSCKNCEHGVRLSWRATAYVFCNAAIPLVLAHLILDAFADLSAAFVRANEPGAFLHVYAFTFVAGLPVTAWTQVRHTPIRRR